MTWFILRETSSFRPKPNTKRRSSPTSIMSVETDKPVPSHKRPSLKHDAALRGARFRRTSHLKSIIKDVSGSSTPDASRIFELDSSESEGSPVHHADDRRYVTAERLEKAIEPIVLAQEESNKRLHLLAKKMDTIARRGDFEASSTWNRDWWIVVVILIFQAVLHYIFNRPVTPVSIAEEE